MLKETETEETKAFLQHFHHKWHFDLGGGPGPLPHGYAYDVASDSNISPQAKVQSDAMVI